MQRKETIMKYYHAHVMIDNKQTEKKEHIINHYKQILENELNYAPNDEVILLIKRMMKSKKNLSRFSR